jgi:hypothetical protein
MHRILLLILGIFLFSSVLGQEVLVSGHVFDAQTSAALPNVNISIVGESGGAVSNTEGYFELRVRQLPALLYFSHVGYAIDQITVTRSNRNKINLSLSPETLDIEEVMITASKVYKLPLGDTLNVTDYSFAGENRMLLAAAPYKNRFDQYLYLTDLNGKQLARIQVPGLGKQIKVPEHMYPEKLFFFKDFLGTTVVLTQQDVRDVSIQGDSICFTNSTSYPMFLKYVFPVKAELGGSIFYQQSSKTTNTTLRTGPDAYRPQVIYNVKDPLGTSRYMYPPIDLKSVYKNVSVPIVVSDGQLLVFDFFQHQITFLDSVGKITKMVPIDFHSIMVKDLLLFKNQDLNQKEFNQEILKDESNGKLYAVFHKPGKRASLKELSPQTGEIIRTIEIPDLQSIDKIKVDGNFVFFLYQVKAYPFYNSLYKMKI